MKTSNPAYLRWLNIIAYLLTVLVNDLAGSTTILGGRNTAQVSDANPTLVTPAGYVFSIWGVIYILLGVFVVFQALPAERGKNFQKSIGPLFILSSVLNIIWLFLWQFEFLSLSVVIMFLLLSTLISIYLRLNIGKSKSPMREKLAVNLPFSVYLGWITIASIANVSVTLVSIKWNGFGISPETWAILIIIVAMLIALLVITTRKDVAYGLVIIWALVGISVMQSGNQSIVTTAGIGAIILAISLIAIVVFVKFKRR
ncbi:MAG: TspO/MBR family protein [Nitrososphaeria archaeon]|jgi:hypothetical protein